MLELSRLHIVECKEDLAGIPEGKVLINTVNAHSYNVAQKDEEYAEALTEGGYLLPDGASIVAACRWLKGMSQPRERIAGWDLFAFEMERLERKSEKLRVMFMGSSVKVLDKIRERAAVEYPNLSVFTYSPP